GDGSMVRNFQIKKRSFFVLMVMLLAGICGGGGSRLWAKGASATILGTVTDTSGAAIPNAMVQVKNTGTGVTQSVAADAQGRFRVSDIGIGEYEVQASQTGFSTGVHKA